MSRRALPTFPLDPGSLRRLPRAVWHTAGLLLALLLAYAIWRGYQSPDFLLDLAAFRLC